MRSDALGFFWEDLPAVKALKAPPVKCVPPDPVWEKPDYLPGLDLALAFNPPQLTMADLLTAGPKEELLFDVECYENYFLVSFESMTTGKVVCFERSDWCDFDGQQLLWVMQNYCIVGFNSISYDAVITTLAISGQPCSVLKWATNKMIVEEARGSDILKQLKIKKLNFNHMDLIEVAPLRANLKIYGGRLHSRRMQDLPFAPNTVLSREQAIITKYYNIQADLQATRLLRESLQPQIDLRYQLSEEYGVDLRSKSDAQIAEAIIADEVGKLNGNRPKQPEIEVGTVFKYKLPSFIKFHSPLMNWALQNVLDADFVIGEHGAIIMPEVLKDMLLKVGEGAYQMGIGGLHSTESKTTHIANSIYRLLDRDVTSFYPMIILLLGLFPQHLGLNFLRVYKTLVDRRIAAKRSGQACKKAGDKKGETMWKNIAESLKIVINGSFGKLGSKYSVLYAPDLLMQVTITGQLLLLMQIERMQLSGIQVVSANTDGVVMKVRHDQYELYKNIIANWEKETGFETEETEYLMLMSRDVNNYMAFKKPEKDGDKVEMKGKGAFANPWNDPSKKEPWMHKNPANTVCIEAIEKMMTTGKSIEQSIRECTDITKFISIRTVKGGAVKDGEFLGKSIRWYYAASEQDKAIVYAKSGKQVPRSTGAKPCMDLPEQLPADIDYDWYIGESESMLRQVGYL